MKTTERFEQSRLIGISAAMVALLGFVCSAQAQNQTGGRASGGGGGNTIGGSGASGGQFGRTTGSSTASGAFGSEGLTGGRSSVGNTGMGQGGGSQGGPGIGQGQQAGGLGGGTTTGGVSQANPFRSFYANPLGQGSTTGRRTAFGSPIYSITTTRSTGTSTNLGRSAGGLGGMNSGLSGGLQSLNNSNTPKSATYATSLGFRAKPVPAATLQQKLGQVLSQSTSLSANRKINVAMDGSVVVLRGSVASDRDRRLAENLLRLTPGVYEVRNELGVTGPAGDEQ